MADSAEFKASAYFSSHKGFSSALRNWLIAYGIGGPAFIASQQHLWNGIEDSTALCAGLLFLLGTSTQIAATAFLKWVMWKLWIHDSVPSRKKGFLFCLANFASKSYVVDLVADFVSFSAFMTATFMIGHELLVKQ